MGVFIGEQYENSCASARLHVGAAGATPHPTAFGGHLLPQGEKDTYPPPIFGIR
jgi:hypothetical protein